MTRICRTIVAVLALTALLAGPLAAAPPAPAKPLAKPADPVKPAVVLGPGRGQVILTWDEFVRITGYDPTKKGTQVLTIPFAQVEEMLGVKVQQVGKSATVDLPWQDFKALLEWSLKKKTPTEAAPPTDFITLTSQYKGDLADDGAIFTLTAKLNVLRKDGWKRIPLLPGQVAIRKSTLPEGVFLHAQGNAYELLTTKSGELDVTVEFAVAVQKSGGTGSATFPRVLAGSSVLDVGAGADVDITISGAQTVATARAAAGAAPRKVGALPTGAPVAVSWQRALPKVAKAPTKLFAETKTLVAVAEGLLVCNQTVTYNVLHAPVRELKLTVPDKASVLTVTGTNVQDWQVAAGQMTVVLGREAIGQFELRINFESPGGQAATAPVIQPVGTQRQKGYVAVVAMTNVEIAAGKVEGATEIDVRRLPADVVSMTNQPILLAFRYAAEKFAIPLTIKRHGEVAVLVTIADTALFTGMQLNDGRRITRVVYSVRNNRNQFLRMTMPPGAEIWSVSVSGNTVAPAKDEKGNVLIPLVRSSTRASDLSSFPVEMVYVETPPKAPSTQGKLHVTLPGLDVPSMHVMYNCYLPAEGKYTVGWGDSGFSGPLAVVKDFTTLSTGPAMAMIRQDMAKQVEQLQSSAQQQVETRARAAGATPIRVRLPVNGQLFKLEKILALPQDKLFFDVAYRDWKPAE